MKKSLLSIVILALGIINLILSAVIIFAVVPTVMKTNNLITKVASNIDLEVGNLVEVDNQVSLEDTEVYPISEEMTINLKASESDKTDYYVQVNVSFSINKKHEDYKGLNPTVAQNEDAIKEIVYDEFSKYHNYDVMENKQDIKIAIIKRVQEYFGSDFIYSMSIGKSIVASR